MEGMRAAANHARQTAAWQNISLQAIGESRIHRRQAPI